jgi:putative ABC transport system ATP-binding protein
VSSPQPILEVRGLKKTFRMGEVEVHAVRGVDLVAQAGEFIAIVGPSGSGKSTLFHVIGGLTPPTSGSVLIEGQDLAGMSERQRTELRKSAVGFVFQKFNLLPTLTARENIEIARDIAGNHSPVSDDFKDVVKILGIDKRLDHKPYALSGGEQQRVAIARAIVNQPRILLADEPTGNLDTANSELVLTTLKQLNRELGQTILMITHNPEAAAFVSDRRIEMRDGLINRDAWTSGESSLRQTP